MAAVSRQDFGLLESMNARSNAVLERMGLRSQDGPLTSPPPSAMMPQRNVSRIPTLKTAGEVKMVAGYRLSTASKQMEAVLESVQRLKDGCPHCNPTEGHARLPEAPKRRTEVPRPPKTRAPVPRAPVSQAPVPAFKAPVPTPPKGPPPKTQKPRPGLRLRATFPSAKPSLNREEALSALVNNKADAEPYGNPSTRLSQCFDLLASDDWQKKMSALDTLQTLIVQHQETVELKLHEVCLVLIDEVKNLRSSVACAAIDAMAMLYLHFQQIMDNEVERTARALLLRLAQGREKFIREKVSVALDALVQNCNYRRVVTALLNSGHKHCSIPVRASTAEHLGQVVDSVGIDDLFGTGRYFIERVVIAVCNMALDPAPEVRHEGQRILKELAQYQDFLQLCNDHVSTPNRRELKKILQKNF